APAADPPPWSGGAPKANFAANSALPGSSGYVPPPAGDDFGSTSLDRPAFEVDAKQPPAAAWTPPAAKSAPAAKRPPGPPPAARPAGSSIPQYDLGLKIALGALVALIVVSALVIVVGVVMQLGGDEAEFDETTELE